MDLLEPRKRLDGQVALAEPDPSWPLLFERERDRIRAALGDAAALVEHVGSTSVPGLLAKPIIDIALGVADSAAEAAYIPALEAVGYIFSIREPEWHEHRLLRREDPAVHLHVFTVGSTEIARLLSFRDRLRTDTGERERYAAAKRDLAARRWSYLQDYADAKSDVVEGIIARAR
jgi:GrpB-like predicted nucleotidyltransferase (UPF0157 family)